MHCTNVSLGGLKQVYSLGKQNQSNREPKQFENRWKGQGLMEQQMDNLDQNCDPAPHFGLSS